MGKVSSLITGHVYRRVDRWSGKESGEDRGGQNECDAATRV